MVIIFMKKLVIVKIKNSWIVKEFLNTVLKKEYDSPYDNNNFTNIIVDAISNIDETTIENIDENKLIK